MTDKGNRWLQETSTSSHFLTRLSLDSKPLPSGIPCGNLTVVNVTPKGYNNISAIRHLGGHPSLCVFFHLVFKRNSVVKKLSAVEAPVCTKPFTLCSFVLWGKPWTSAAAQLDS
ncbi:hypothetical protein V6N13_143546 [Hibiscus sabdariffa]|uniref:Uncharacterized protein n=1 Tax=Hibiscus sabdariffa TaxID=183260 RepID=A0ABR2FHP8_9ROSI